MKKHMEKSQTCVFRCDFFHDLACALGTFGSSECTTSDKGTERVQLRTKHLSLLIQINCKCHTKITHPIAHFLLTFLFHI